MSIRGLWITARPLGRRVFWLGNLVLAPDLRSQFMLGYDSAPPSAGAGGRSDGPRQRRWLGLLQLALVLALPASGAAGGKEARPAPAPLLRLHLWPEAFAGAYSADTRRQVEGFAASLGMKVADFRDDEGYTGMR